MHLVDSYEQWLGSQSAPREKARLPKKPAEDLYELWLVKRVERRLKTSGTQKRVAG
jgi:hypothetical protein